MSLISTKIPGVRFKGHRSAWETCLLKEMIALEFKGKAKASMEGTRTPFLETTYLNGGKISYVDASSNVEKDDVLILWDGAQAGKVYHGFTGALGSTLKAYRPKESGAFLYQVLQKNKKKIFECYRTPNIPHVIKEFTDEFELSKPKEDEQIKIGECFKEIEKLIALYQQTYDLMKSKKITLISKLFSKNKGTIPNTRFIDFTFEWEMMRLSDIAQITMGQSPNSSAYTKNPEDAILVQGNMDMKDRRVFPRVWTKQITKKAQKGDLILSVRAPVGEVGKTDYDVVIGRGVAAIKGNDFIYYSLERMKIIGYWEKFSSGTTFKEINKNDIKSAEIFIPSEKEQEKIGQLLKKIDEIITFIHLKLKILQLLEISLRKKMFAK